MSDGTCSVDECGAVILARGLCSTHYGRDQRAEVRARLIPCAAPSCDRSAEHVGLCDAHYQRMRRTGSLESAHPSVEGRFFEKMIVGSAPAHRPELGPCWVWMACINPAGYGIFDVGDENSALAHRWAHQHFIGPIPDDLTLDHLCHDPFTCFAGVGCPHRRCVNPRHTATATRAENSRRSWVAVKTHCKNGHEFTPENTYRRPGQPTQRICRACVRERSRRR